jgi:hypothetical protein
VIIEKKSFDMVSSFSFVHSKKQVEIDNMPMKQYFVCISCCYLLFVTIFRLKICE